MVERVHRPVAEEVRSHFGADVYETLIPRNIASVKRPALETGRLTIPAPGAHVYCKLVECAGANKRTAAAATTIPPTEAPTLETAPETAAELMPMPIHRPSENRLTSRCCE